MKKLVSLGFLLLVMLGALINAGCQQNAGVAASFQLLNPGQTIECATDFHSRDWQTYKVIEVHGNWILVEQLESANPPMTIGTRAWMNLDNIQLILIHK